MKDAQHRSLLEKCKSKPQWDITSHQSKWPSSKCPHTINAGKIVEKMEHSCTVGGNINWYSHYGEQYGDSLKKNKKECIWVSSNEVDELRTYYTEWSKSERERYVS